MSQNTYESLEAFIRRLTYLKAGLNQLTSKHSIQIGPVRVILDDPSIVEFSRGELPIINKKVEFELNSLVDFDKALNRIQKVYHAYQNYLKKSPIGAKSK